MFFSVAILSGVFNNTPIVVMMIPLLQSLCTSAAGRGCGLGSMLGALKKVTLVGRS